MLKSLLIALLFSVSLLNTTQGQMFFYEPGDTLTVISDQGAVFRAGRPVDTLGEVHLSFGDKVIASGQFTQRQTIKDRKGAWIKAKLEAKEGYVFSGYVTRLHIPPFKANDQECNRLSWFETIARANADSLVSKGAHEYKGFDPAGNDRGTSKWELFDNETMIYHIFGFHSENLVIESRYISMNDVLNLLEYYLDRLKATCPEEFQYRDTGALPYTKTSKDNQLDRIECQPMGFVAERSINKTIVRLRL